jgi:MoxR-like ATPase
MKENLLSPEQLRPAFETSQKILCELDKILLGKEKLHRMVLSGLISRGHILFEGLPGVGKTALVKAISQILQLDFKRIQFTPDLMPSDILGTNILQENASGKRDMVFQQGAVFTNILLADEINRASPKTQSALLEAMQEGSVTLLGKTRPLPQPFFVLASQNPIEMEGTYPIPEAQLDRFMLKLNVTTVETETLSSIITERRRGIPPIPTWQASTNEIQELFDTLDKIILPEPVAHYISRLVSATHPSSKDSIEISNEYLSYGASPRAAIALAESARAIALLNNRPSVGFEDVKTVAEAVLNHRLILNYKARMDKVSTFDIIKETLNIVQEVDLKLPGDISIKS